jgi:2'-5' RNA ligase
MQKTIRAFVAIHLPEEVRNYLGSISGNLSEQLPPHTVRWVKPDRLHLTLRFLGDTEVTLLPDIHQALDGVTVRQQRFDLHLEDFGCFPNCQRPRVLWAGVAGQLKEATKLKEGIDAALLPFGWDAEKRSFRPHLTIGRVKNARKAVAPSWPDSTRRLAIPVDAIHLIESELTPDGPIYTVRHSSPLR